MYRFLNQFMRGAQECVASCAPWWRGELLAREIDVLGEGLAFLRDDGQFEFARLAFYPIFDFENQIASPDAIELKLAAVRFGVCRAECLGNVAILADQFHRPRVNRLGRGF